MNYLQIYRHHPENRRLWKLQTIQLICVGMSRMSKEIQKLTAILLNTKKLTLLSKLSKDNTNLVKSIILNNNRK